MCAIFFVPYIVQSNICTHLSETTGRRGAGKACIALSCFTLSSFGNCCLTCKFGFICMKIWSNYGICQRVGMYGRNFVKTRPKPACGQQGLVGRIVRPGCSSNRYILGSSQHLASCLQRSTRIGYCRSKCSEHSESHFFWTSQKWWIETLRQPCCKWQPLFHDSGGVPNDRGEEAGQK